MPVRAYVVNGIAIDSKGVIYTANTGTGEITSIVIGAGYTARLDRDFRPGPPADRRRRALHGRPGQPLGGRQLQEHAGARRPRRHRDHRGLQHTRREVHRLHHGARLPADRRGKRPPVPAELKRIGETMYLANLNFPIGANTGQPIKGATVAAVDAPLTR